jgi:4-amino-4-deoxy-L-arabinose transferase-like glycosyltransferase
VTGDSGRRRAGAIPDLFPASGLRLAAMATMLAVVLGLRLYRLNDAPADIYGDIVILLKYVRSILAGGFPFYFVDSTGPLYHYLVAPLGLVLGLNYLTVKTASVIASLAALACTYLLAREAGAGRRVAWLAVLLGGVSCWLLIFSRLGNSQIITPVLSALTFLFLARARRCRRRRDLACCAVVSAMGLYAYPQTFVLAPAAAVPLLWWCWRKQLPWRWAILFVAIVAALTLPFMAIVVSDPADFVGGYIGGKLLGHDLGARLLAWPPLLVKSLLMFNWRGDNIFRSNPPGLPQLDPVSGCLFLIGIGQLVRRRYATYRWVTLWPLLFLQIPSTLVLNFPGEVPSASRTLLVTPFVYTIAALGMERLFLPASRSPEWLRTGLLLATSAVITVLNAERYFAAYIPQQPNRNVSFTREIARVIDSVPAGTAVSFYGCCWGEWSTPEWEDIPWALARPRDIYYQDAGSFNCGEASTIMGPQLIIADPTDEGLAQDIYACFSHAAITLAEGPDGMLLYRAFWVPDG